MQVTKNSQQLIKESHLKLIFSLIHKNDGISRADIKKITKLSATTVSALVEELIESGLVIESGIKDASMSGRKAIALSVDKNGGYFAVVTISGHHFRLRLYNLEFEGIFSKKIRYNNSLPLSLTLRDFLTENIYIKNHGDLLGLCIGVPAIIDNEYNIVSSTVLNIEKNDNLYKTLKNEFENTEIAICNNSILIAYAEKEFGNTDVQNLISVDISDGVGASAIIGGSPFIGSAGMACEFGHVSIDINGEKCRCGSRGCIETLVSIPAILEKASEICGKEITAEELSAVSSTNSVLAKHLDYVCSTLAFGINNLLNIMDPDAVVICGDIQLLGESFLKKLRENLASISLPGRHIPVTFSTLGNHAEFKGGAKFIFDCLFK